MVNERVSDELAIREVTGRRWKTQLNTLKNASGEVPIIGIEKQWYDYEQALFRSDCSRPTPKDMEVDDRTEIPWSKIIHAMKH